MDAAAAFLAERQAFRSTLVEVGPDAPSLIEGWTAADVAAHVLGGEQAAGVPVFVARLLIARGVDFRGFNRSAAVERSTTRQRQRMAARGVDWLVDRFRRPPPKLFLRRSVAPLSLFEVWVHHEDVRRANGRRADTARNHPALADCFDFLARYLRKALEGTTVLVHADGHTATLGSGPERVTVRGPVGEAVLWLAGRTTVAEVEVEGARADTLVGRLDI